MVFPQPYSESENDNINYQQEQTVKDIYSPTHNFLPHVTSTNNVIPKPQIWIWASDHDRRKY